MLNSVVILSLVLTGPGADEVSGPLILEDAQVTLIDQRRVPAKEAGALAELSVKEGDLVEPGQLLGRIEDDLARIDERLARVDHEIAKLQSENDVDYRFAQKSLEVAQSELKRSQEAVKLYEKSISKTELDRLSLMVERSALSKEQAERDMQVADLNEQLKDQSVQLAAKHVERRTILAPIGGMVVEVVTHPGEWLNPGDPVLRIIQLDRLRVEAFVDGTKHGDELLGCPVQLEATLPPDGRTERFEGSIVFVSPELDPVNGQGRIWAEVENRNLRLRPGMRGKLLITYPKPPSGRASSSD